jgi:hypothetical protein
MRVPCRPRPARAAIAGAACAAETRGEVSERRAWLSSPSVRSFCYPDTGTTTPAPMMSCRGRPAAHFVRMSTTRPPTPILAHGKQVLSAYYRPETLQSVLARRVFVFPDRVG